jgi:hypothetical protein
LLSGNVTLGNEESILFFIQNNYSGLRDVEINTTRSTATDRLLETFAYSSLELSEFNVLKSLRSSSVFESRITNNLQNLLSVSLKINTGTVNISDNNLTNVNGSVIAFVETSYAANGVYKPQAFVNATSYQDNKSQVVVI